MLLPRSLIFLSFLWLVVSWGLAIGFRPPIQPTPAAYEPGVRTMLILLLLGMLMGWPLYRLSQPRAVYPIRQTLLDVLVMLAMVQVVVWPLRLVTTWTRGRTAAMDFSIIGWALIASSIVMIGIAVKSRRARTLAMSMCAGVCFLGPVAAWIAVYFGVDLLSLVGWSPLMGMYELGNGKGAAPTTSEWTMITALNGIGVAMWIVCMFILRPGTDVGGRRP